MTIYIIISIISYFIGSISFSVIFSRKFAGFDVRDKGSGNAGTTNVLRSVGKKAAAITLLCDILKGVIAIGVAVIASKIWKEVNVEILKYLAGFFAILGHTFVISFAPLIGRPIIITFFFSLTPSIITTILLGRIGTHVP